MGLLKNESKDYKRLHFFTSNENNDISAIIEVIKEAFKFMTLYSLI